MRDTDVSRDIFSTIKFLLCIEILKQDNLYYINVTHFEKFELIRLIGILRHIVVHMYM